MSGPVTSEMLRRWLDAGLTDEQIIMTAEAMEARGELVEVFRILIERLQEAGATSAAIGAALYEVGQAAIQRDQRTRTRPPAPCGPKERWGYDGPVTPRLPEREWWPLRNSIVREADSTCTYCGEQHDYMCADHVVPLSRGGTNERDNLVCCCVPCNSSKADRLVEEWNGRYR